MPKDWGENWKTCYIPKPYRLIMNKALGIVIAVVIVGGISVYALSPYFTETTIDEALPTGAITQSAMEDKESMMMKDDAMMEEEKMMKNAMMEEEKMMKDNAIWKKRK